MSPSYVLYNDETSPLREAYGIFKKQACQIIKK